MECRFCQKGEKMIIKETQIAFKLTPKELANEFCEMDANEQAEFFNKENGNLQQL